jgi:hypothetical protein
LIAEICGRDVYCFESLNNCSFFSIAELTGTLYEKENIKLQNFQMREKKLLLSLKMLSRFDITKQMFCIFVQIKQATFRVTFKSIFLPLWEKNSAKNK